MNTVGKVIYVKNFEGQRIFVALQLQSNYSGANLEYMHIAA